jgi:hypothetical protein
MAIQKIFAYNTGSLVSGTTQVGDIAVSEADVEYSANYGGLQWWGGPDETNGYVIAHSDPSRVPDYLGFWRSSGLTDSDFLTLCNSIPPRIGDTPFTNTDRSLYVVRTQTDIGHHMLNLLSVIHLHLIVLMQIQQQFQR